MPAPFLRHVAALVLLLGVSPAWAGDFEEGFAAYSRGDFQTAIRLLRPLAERGDPDAQFRIGRMYQNGHGMPLDQVKAAEWYRRAAEQGYAYAQNNLGEMYRNGWGLPVDYSQAVKWYRRAAEQGDSLAQSNLSNMYFDGLGVARNYKEALKWNRLSADQWFIAAQFNLGSHYANGDGLPRDYVQAHLWLSLAAEGIAESDRIYSIRRDAIYARKNVEAVMTPAQIAEAERLKFEWLLLHWKVEDKGKSVGLAGPAPARLPLESSSSADPVKHEQTPTVVPPSTATRELVATAQNLLAALGYDPGPTDGRAGPQTRAAIEAFQSASNLPVDGAVSGALVASLSHTLAAAQQKPQRQEATERTVVSTGTGFVIDTSGNVVTNYHVVEACDEIRLSAQNSPASQSSIVASDANNDLALLRGPAGVKRPARFSEGRRVRPGEGIAVVGYPLQGLLSSQASVTLGNVSSLAGPGDDARYLQITAPVQPGSSGSPLLNMSGSVIGIVVGKLDAIRVAMATGDIPQNVNFAIKAAVVRSFLETSVIDYLTDTSEVNLAPPAVAERSMDFTVLVECMK